MVNLLASQVSYHLDYFKHRVGVAGVAGLNRPQYFQFEDASSRRRRDADDSAGDPAPATESPKQVRKGSGSTAVLVRTLGIINNR
jgi:hypothetical protein